MLFPETPPTEKRKNLRSALSSGRLLQFPGSWSPLLSMAIEQNGFDGVYISGSVLSNDLGYPDIGLATLTEMSQRGRQIARTTNLPSLIDIDTGFGEPMNATRAVQEMIDLGLSGCHIEDQVNPKRCGHLDGKQIVAREDMVRKVAAAVRGKKLDENFLLIARTDSRATEGIHQAIERSKAYVGAGADCIFVEALENEKEFEAFRSAIRVPLLANMTEFGKSKLLTYDQISNLGYNIVIYPVTTFRLAMKASIDGLVEIKRSGTQEGLLKHMQHRQELYKLSRYEEYNSFDQSVFNFEIK
jgi:methylisocitrate lyase